MTETESYIIEKYCGGAVIYEDGEAAFEAFYGALKESLSPAFGSLCTIVCLVIAAAVIKAFSESLYEGDGPFELCVTLSFSLLLYETLKRSYETVTLCFSGIDALMDSMIAVMCTMYGLSGEIVGGSASVTVIMAVMQTVRLISTKILLPLLTVCFGASLLSGFGFNAGLAGFASAVKRGVVFLCTACGAAVCFVLGYQKIITAASDTAALRGLRFAASSFIPVIGSTLSESLSVVSSAVSSVKAYSGVGGVISIAVLVIPPLIVILAGKLGIRAGAALCGVLGLDRVKPLFEDCASLLTVLFAVVVTVGIVFTVAFSLFSIK